MMPMSDADESRVQATWGGKEVRDYTPGTGFRRASHQGFGGVCVVDRAGRGGASA